MTQADDPREGLQRITVRLRLRDKHSSELRRQARAVNFVWNYCNETQRKAVAFGRKWLSAFDLQRLTAGSSAELGLHAHTIQRVCLAYERARKAHNRPWLRWRGQKALGWVPFNTDTVRVLADGYVGFRGAVYQCMHWRGYLSPDIKIGAGSFNQDARGRWYVNLTIEASPCPLDEHRAEVGIDLGLKQLAVLSTGEKIDAPRLYRTAELRLATAQRAKKSRRVRNIHAKVANRRRDFLHKLSADLTKEFGTIVVGDVASHQIAKTQLGKSVNDAGWSTLRNMLSYKAIRHGGRCIVVSERLSTQTCSTCGSLPASRPKGIAGLGIREWRCDDCGTVHDRDINAARNILRVGLDALAKGVPS